MRLLFVSQEMPPETGWGGIGTYVDVLSHAIAAKGVEVHVLSVVEGQAASRRELDGVTVHRRPLPRVRGRGRLPRETWPRVLLPATVTRLIRRLQLRPDVVECPEWMAEGLGLALEGSAPLVVRLHSSAGQLFPYTGQGRGWLGLDRRVSAWLEQFSARRANVVVSTRSNLEEVAGRIGLDKRALHAIPYPVRLPPLAPMPASGPPRVTFVGRLEPRKAPDVLLAAAPGVLESIPNARFVFVGRDEVQSRDGSMTERLRREAQRLGVEHAVEFTGQLSPDGVAEQLRRATVCAFPSRWESFGNVVAEACATGRPVAVSAIAPFRELVADRRTGRIAPLDDPGVWAAALIELLSDRERAAAMGRAGALRVAGISDPGRIAELALAAHEHAIERFRRGERAARG